MALCFPLQDQDWIQGLDRAKPSEERGEAYLPTLEGCEAEGQASPPTPHDFHDL